MKKRGQYKERLQIEYTEIEKSGTSGIYLDYGMNDLCLSYAHQSLERYK